MKAPKLDKMMQNTFTSVILPEVEFMTKIKNKLHKVAKQLVVDRRVETIRKDGETSTQWTRDATNEISDSSTSTWIKFDIVGKSGIKLQSLDHVDLGVYKSFMSYGAQVFFGQPNLDTNE